MGANEAVLLSDRAVSDSDTWATSNALSAIINTYVEREGGYDLILGGRQAIDGDTAQVGPQIAEKLGLPQVTYVEEFEMNDNRTEIIVKRKLEDGYEKIKINPPCMLTCIKELNTPRFMSLSRIFDTDKDIKVWSADDVKVDKTIVGLKASPTNVYRSFTPKPKGKGTMLKGDTEKDVAKQLLVTLKKKHVI